MRRPARVHQSMLSLFAPYAAVTLLPVLLLGVVLGVSYRDQARQRGLVQGRTKAALVAETAVDPMLDWYPLSSPMPVPVVTALNRMATRTISAGTVLRMRLRDLQGRVVYSDDGSGFGSGSDHEAVEAGRGQVVAKLTRLNVDGNDSGRKGVQAVEVYQPLVAGWQSQRVGVLEIYLPYAPIAHDVAVGLSSTYRNLTLGLVALYLVLLAIAASMSRGLRRQMARTRFLAEYDVLTGLPNRVVFRELAADRLRGHRRRADRTVLAIIDLDRFKAVNDTLGHARGDDLLVALAQRLSAAIGPGDTVARLGGDEFAVILNRPEDPEGALSRLRDAIDEEIELDGVPLSVEASIGYVVAPFDGHDAQELLARAEVAMYAAKERHLGVLRYHPSQDRYDSASLALVAQLRHAIDADQLVLHYQPKVRLSDSSIEAVEALVRWEHPVHGLLYPDRFLPLAEQTDLIDRLTDWVVRRALADLSATGLPNLSVAVNVSARNLTDAGLAGKVLTALGEAGVAPGRLIVELTETALLVDPVRAGSVLAELATAGVRVSLDDFGQGHTSLGYLSSLPVHELKIDRSLVGDLRENPAHEAIVRSVVELGHNLGLTVVAEGVETVEIRSLLGETGCDVGQGYLFARPMHAGELPGWLALTSAIGEIFS